MIDLILKDAKIKPALFRWRGGIDQITLEAWQRNQSIGIPADLFDFWKITGGGDFFESETILSPAATEESENVEAVSELHWRKGLDRKTLVFHKGSFISIVTDRPH